MLDRIRRYPFTFAAAALAAAVFAGAVFGDVDVVALNVGLLEGLQKNELDEVVVTMIAVVLALVVDLRGLARERAKQAAVQAARLRVQMATMRTVQEVVNKFLGNAQHFRDTIGAYGGRDMLELFDHCTRDTADKVRALGGLESIPEAQVAGAVGQGRDEAMPRDAVRR